MNKKKKGEIAGIPYDEWLEEKDKKTRQKVTPQKYSNKLIAFLDVLGIKDLIEQHRNGNEYIAIDKIRQIRKIIESSVKMVDSIDYLQISDSFVFVCDPKDIISLIKLLSIVQTRIISECHFLLRGAVTIGDAIVQEDGKFIIGPAYIKAYQLQENDAIYPRIIVDKNVINEIKKNNKPIIDFLRHDSDKEYFIDYIKVYMQIESLKKQAIKIILRRENIFNSFETRFKDYFKKENHNICQKYGWTIQYYKILGVWEDE